ncbi:MAG TPA: serine hydrolase domain-containing protein [Blastocatellia bacterium]|nr:serine hydrolase domain-containing protein [Blastocatellia bacterium]
MIHKLFAKTVWAALMLVVASLILKGTVAQQAPAEPKPAAVTPLKVDNVAELARKIQLRFLELRKESDFPGANIGIVWGNDRAMSVSVGFSDLENEKALKPTDRMLAGSIGKTYVSAVTLQLVEEGKLELDDKIEKWLGKEPWFDRLPNARTITLRMLMNHTSGIPEHVQEKAFAKAMLDQPDKVWKPEELVAYILDRKPLFEAGKGWSYADTNYIVVGMIFERVSGKTVYGEVQRRILDKLKLKETLPSDSRTIAGLIPGYSQIGSPFGFEGRTIIEGKFIVNPQMEWCGGGFASTAQDLARWAKFLYEGKVLDRPSMKDLLDAVPAKTGRGDKYGLGVQVRESQWGISYGHGGWFPGYLSEMEYFPQYKAAIAVQLNTDDIRNKLKRRPRAFVAEVASLVFGSTP